LDQNSEYNGFIVYRDEDRQDLMNQRARNSHQEDLGTRMEEIRKIADILADVKRNKFPDIDKFTQKDVDEIYKLAKKNKGYGEYFSIKFGDYIYNFLQTWKPGQCYDDMIAQVEKYKYSAEKLEFIERFELS
jgi:hypothetical protein